MGEDRGPGPRGSGAGSGATPDGVGPWWRERQDDPTLAEPAAVAARVASGEPAGNLTHRDWAIVGTRDAPERALVDPRGLVTPVPGGWSLDWWVGAEDRWHLPSREAGVRQRLVDGAPVIETAMRIPGGDAVQRVYAAKATVDDGGGDHVVVEIANRSAVPVALALAVRPYHPGGAARIERIETVPVSAGAAASAAPTGVRIDGRLGLVLPRTPARAVARRAADGDCLAAVIAGDAPADGSLDVDDPDGAATAAALYPLPHTAVLRVLLPLHLPVERRGRGTRRGPAVSVRVPEAVPTGDQVAAGWQAQARRGLRASLPDPALSDLFGVIRGWLLVAHGGADIVDGAGHTGAAALAVPDLVPVVAALGEHGFADEAAQVLGSWEERQDLDGSFGGDTHRLDATGLGLWGAARHWALTGDDEVAASLVGSLTRAARWIDRRRTARRPRRDPATVGLLPDGAGPAFAAPGLGQVARYRDDLWALVALRDAVGMFAGIDQPDVAAAAGGTAAALAARLDAALEADASTVHGPMVPLGPGRGAGREVVGSLDALAVGALAPTHPALLPTLDLVAADAVAGVGVSRPDGPLAGDAVDPALTAWLARAELRTGRVDAAARRLAWLVEHATTVGTWPELWWPTTRGGGAGAGFSVPAVAAVASLLRDLLVREVPAPGGDPATATSGLALLSWVPEPWFGQGVEVHDAPTAVGPVSFAVRWHGERPALLWERTARRGGGEVRLTVPGLDPSWSSTEPRGEALLAPPGAPRPAPSDGARPGVSPVSEAGPRAPSPPPAEGGSFS